MKVLRVEGELHWGFWIRFVDTSKMQSSYSIFPPTTLIGALASSIFNLGLLKNDYGEVFLKDGKFLSPTVIVEDFFLAASAYFKKKVKGLSAEDINKYVTIHFHQFATNLQVSAEYLGKPAEIPSLTDEERIILKIIHEKGYIEPSGVKKALESEEKKISKKQLSEEQKKLMSILDNALSKHKSLIENLKRKGMIKEIKRRFLPKYRTSAILVGKTYIAGEFVAAYLLNEEMVSKALSEGLNKLSLAAWNITRLGSKESIVSINNVELLEAKKLEKDTVTTLFYFPKSLLSESESIQGNYYIETFWEGGWGREYFRRPVDYVIPGEKMPIESSPITVRLSNRAIAYQVKEENEVLIVRK